MHHVTQEQVSGAIRALRQASAEEQRAASAVRNARAAADSAANAYAARGTYGRSPTANYTGVDDSAAARRQGDANAAVHAAERAHSDAAARLSEARNAVEELCARLRDWYGKSRSDESKLASQAAQMRTSPRDGFGAAKSAAHADAERLNRWLKDLSSALSETPAATASMGGLEAIVGGSGGLGRTAGTTSSSAQTYFRSDSTRTYKTYGADIPINPGTYQMAHPQYLAHPSVRYAEYYAPLSQQLQAKPLDYATRDREEQLRYQHGWTESYFRFLKCLGDPRLP